METLATVGDGVWEPEDERLEGYASVIHTSRHSLALWPPYFPPGAAHR